jgi:prepilin-type N-terminal cleavage/methylation domain-containing protein
MNRRHGRGAGAGFTLAELLIVLAIIGVLLGLLLPVASRLRVRSKRTSCKATLAQLGVAVELYRNAHRGKFPRALMIPWVAPIAQPTPDPKPLVSELLRPYVADAAAAFHCAGDDFEQSGQTCFKQYGLSYAYHEDLGERPMEQTLAWGYAKTASQVSVLWDADFFHGGHPPDNMNGSNGDYKWNYLFADGHVAEFEESDPNGIIIVQR